jgi:hypothetical protein
LKKAKQCTAGERKCIEGKKKKEKISVGVCITLKAVEDNYS